MKARQLKNSLLQLAVQGKLVPQDPHDEPASILLERIAQERERLIQEKKIKKPKSTSRIFRCEGHFYESVNGGVPACIDEEIPFDIPPSWEWTRLGCVFRLFSTGPFGSMVHQSDYTDLPSGIPLINPTNIKNGCISRDGLQRVRKEKSESLANYRLSEGDIIVARRGDLSKCAIITKKEEQWLCGTGSFFLHLSFVVNEYFYYFYASSYTQSMLLGESVGTTMVNLNQRLLNGLLFPLPPLREQQRIVQKIEELLPYIEEYGKHEEQLSALDKTFPQALKKSLLQWAVQGKLVPQNPQDEPASVLLERIAQERERLIQEKKIKRPKSTSHIYRRDGHFYESINGGEATCIDGEIPFDIPDSWEWVRCSQLITLSSGQDLPPHKYNDKRKGIPYITGASNFDKGSIIFNRWTEEPKTLAERGYILLTCKGTIGELAVLNEKQAHIARQIMGIRPMCSCLQNYLLFILKFNMQLFKTKAQGMIPGISRDVVLETIIPLPPLAEQGRICGKLDKMLNTLRD